MVIHSRYDAFQMAGVAIPRENVAGDFAAHSGSSRSRHGTCRSASRSTLVLNGAVFALWPVMWIVVRWHERLTAHANHRATTSVYWEARSVALDSIGQVGSKSSRRSWALF